MQPQAAPCHREATNRYRFLLTWRMNVVDTNPIYIAAGFHTGAEVAYRTGSVAAVGAQANQPPPLDASTDGPSDAGAR